MSTCPTVSLESVIEQNQEAYYLALRRAQGSVRTDALKWQPWLVCFLREPDVPVALEISSSGNGPGLDLLFRPCRRPRDAPLRNVLGPLLFLDPSEFELFFVAHPSPIVQLNCAMRQMEVA